jgi:MFS family permease
MPLYAQLVLGLSLTASSMTIVALMGGSTVTSIIGGRLLIRFTRYKLVPLAGLLLAMAALTPLAVAPGGFSPLVALTLITIVGFGLGPVFPFTVVVVQNAVALHQLGIATAAMNFFRALGATFLVALFGAIMLAGAPMMRGLPADPSLTGPDAGAAFGFVFGAAIMCLAVAIASILALRERPLRGADTPAALR